jgi:hypothetical protein
MPRPLLNKLSLAVLGLLALAATPGCTSESSLTAPPVARHVLPDSGSAASHTIYADFDCSITVYEGGDSIEDCVFVGYDTSDDSTIPAYYTDACDTDSEACFGGGVASSEDAAWDGSMSLIDNGTAGCAPQLCVHISVYSDPLLKGCPNPMYEGDPAGPHGPEYWTMYLGRTWFDGLAVTTLGAYTGRSVINGFTWMQATATVWCIAGYGVFKGAHP